MVQDCFPDSPVKTPHCWFPQGKKHKCPDENKICKFISGEKNSGLKPALCGSSNLSSYIWKMAVSLLLFFLTAISTRNHDPAVYLRIVRVMVSEKVSFFPFFVYFSLIFFLCVCCISLCLLSWAGDYGKIFLVYLFLEQLNWAFVSDLDYL